MKSFVLFLIVLLTTATVQAQNFFVDNSYEVTTKGFVAIDGLSDICINHRLDRLVVVGDMKDVCELDYDGKIVRRCKIPRADFEAIQWMNGDETGDWYALLSEAGPRLYWVFFPERIWVGPRETPNTISLASAENYKFPGGDVEAFYSDGGNFNVHAFRKHNTAPAYTRVIRDDMRPAHHIVDPNYTMSDLVKSDNYSVRSCFYDPHLCANPIRLHQDSDGNYRLQEFDDSTGQVLSQSNELSLNKGEGIVFKDVNTAYAVADKTIGSEADNFFVIERQR